MAADGLKIVTVDEQDAASTAVGEDVRADTAAHNDDAKEMILPMAPEQQNKEMILPMAPEQQNGGGGGEPRKAAAVSNRLSKDRVGEAALQLPFHSTGLLLAFVALAMVAVSAIVAAAVASMVAGGGDVEASSPVAVPAAMPNGDGVLESRRLATETQEPIPAAVAKVDSTANGSDVVVAGGTASSGAELFCLDAAKGEVCHRLVLWAMDDGLRLHAENFKGLSRASPFAAFQKLLHSQHPEFCPPPCAAGDSSATVAPTLEVAAAEAVVPPAFSPVMSSRGSCNYGYGDSSPGHAGCFIVRGGRLLTTKLTYDGMRYDIPGGQTDWREPARCTAHRETLEETGYNAAPRELLAVVRNNFHIYRCELLQGSPVRGHDHEISWVGWMSYGELRDRAARHRFRFPEATHYADWLR